MLPNIYFNKNTKIYISRIICSCCGLKKIYIWKTKKKQKLFLENLLQKKGWRSINKKWECCDCLGIMKQSQQN